MATPMDDVLARLSTTQVAAMLSTGQLTAHKVIASRIRKRRDLDHQQRSSTMAGAWRIEEVPAHAAAAPATESNPDQQVSNRAEQTAQSSGSQESKAPLTIKVPGLRAASGFLFQRPGGDTARGEEPLLPGMPTMGHL